ncbi:hypothetical protein ACTHAM_001099 [Cellulomonas soli]|uniref:hypothetical protein n=1 Tax=Cellulomonas soli TaxID=931535 RepID=UPI003F86675F
MATTSEAPACRRCGRPVILNREHYETFEGMHYVCFHFEFEHRRPDVDEDCGLRGCPAGELPVHAPSDEAQRVLHDVAETLRAPYTADGPQVDFEQPGVLLVTRSGHRIRLVALDAWKQTQ